MYESIPGLPSSQTFTINPAPSVPAPPQPVPPPGAEEADLSSWLFPLSPPNIPPTPPAQMMAEDGDPAAAAAAGVFQPLTPPNPTSSMPLQAPDAPRYV